MNYSEAINYIEKRKSQGIYFGLDNIQHLMKELGNPQDKLQFIHIAGTNGKGSTLAFITSILISAGYKVGSYSTPSVFNIREMIRINNEWINKEDFSNNITQICNAIHQMEKKGFDTPTEYEIYTAAMFLYFYNKNVDIVVMETCMGGLEDATNIVNSTICSVITSISLDHQNFLGNTLEEITLQKAGIIKNKTNVILYSQKQEVCGIIKNVCKEKNVPLKQVEFESIILLQYDLHGQSFHYKQYKDLYIKQLGDFQLKNAVVAIETVNILKNNHFTILESHIYNGLKNTVWNGRFQIISHDPVFIIDGAHNVDAVCTLRQSIEHYYKNKKVIFIMGVFKDKEYEQMAKEILGLGEWFFAVEPNSTRALEKETLEKVASQYVQNVMPNIDIHDSVEQAIKVAQNYEDTIIVAFGSLSYLSDIYKVLEDSPISKKLCNIV